MEGDILLVCRKSQFDFFFTWFRRKRQTIAIGFQQQQPNILFSKIYKKEKQQHKNNKLNYEKRNYRIVKKNELNKLRRKERERERKENRHKKRYKQIVK